MTDLDARVTFGVIVGTRGYFNPQLALDGRRDLLALLERKGFGSVVLPAAATAHGAVETRADAARCAEHFRVHRDEIHGVIVSLPNFGDELGIAHALEQAELEVPVLVHAFDDELDKVDVKHRRDSFCGKISVCNVLAQHGIRWTDTEEHTCALDSPELAADLDRFARICRVVQGIRGARIAQIGTRPAAFQTVRYSERILQEAGITVVPVDLSEIFAAAQALAEGSSDVREKLALIRGYGRIPDRITADQILRQAKLAAAIDRWMAENGCSASAVQCWESIQRNYGSNACLAMSMMGERGLPSACEVDVAGAVSMLVLRLAAGEPSALLDWNNNYGGDRGKCVNTHCSNFPRGFVGRGVEISEADVLGEALGRERCFGAIKAKVRSGPMTFFRMDTMDGGGSPRGYVGEGEFTDDPFAMDGGIATCRVDNLRRLLGHITAAGFAHHVAMVRGHVSAAVREAAAKYLRWDVYCHNPEVLGAAL